MLSTLLEFVCTFVEIYNYLVHVDAVDGEDEVQGDNISSA